MLNQLDQQYLILQNPIPLTRHPAAVYLNSLGKNSQLTMRYALNTVAGVLTGGKCDALTLDWSQLRYQHTAAAKNALMLKYAPATVNKMLIALRRVLGEAHKLGLMEFSDYEKATAISPLRNTSPLRGRSLSKEEIAALMKTCDAQEPIDIRDTAIIAVLRGSGVRRTELVNLDLFDVDLQSGKLLIRSGKGGKPRTCYIPEFTISFVQKWLTVRGMEPGPLFCRVYKGGRLKLGRLVDDSIWRMLKKRGEMAGLAPFSPHDFRRTFCSDLMDCNVDLVTVQKLVGHSSPLTTAKYDRRGEKTKQRAVQNLDF